MAKITAIVRIDHIDGQPDDGLDHDIIGCGQRRGGWEASWVVYDRDGYTHGPGHTAHGAVIDRYEPDGYDPVFSTRAGAARYASSWIRKKWPHARIIFPRGVSV